MLGISWCYGSWSSGSSGRKAAGFLRKHLSANDFGIWGLISRFRLDLRRQIAASTHNIIGVSRFSALVCSQIKQHLLLDVRSRQRHAGAVADGVDERVPGEAVEHIVGLDAWQQPTLAPVADHLFGDRRRILP